MGSSIHTRSNSNYTEDVATSVSSNNYTTNENNYATWDLSTANKFYDDQGVDMNFAWKRETEYLQTGHSWAINNQLRDAAEKSGDAADPDLSYMKDRERKNVLALDASMSEIPENVMLYRFVGAGVVNQILKANGSAIFTDGDKFDLQQNGINSKYKRLLDSTLETEITDASYMSTSYDPTANVFTGKPFLMRLRTPKGTKGLITNNHGESEVLLNRGTSYKIVGWKVENFKNFWGDIQHRVVLDVQVTGSR